MLILDISLLHACKIHFQKEFLNRIMLFNIVLFCFSFLFVCLFYFIFLPCVTKLSWEFRLAGMGRGCICQSFPQLTYEPTTTLYIYSKCTKQDLPVILAHPALCLLWDTCHPPVGSYPLTWRHQSNYPYPNSTTMTNKTFLFLLIIFNPPCSYGRFLINS